MLVSRPRLLGAILAGAACALAFNRFAPHLPVTTVGIVGWDVMCAVFVVSVTATMIDHNPAAIRARAARQDEGRGVILALVLLAAAISVVAIGPQLSQAKGEHGLLRSAHVALAFGTVAASWLMVQLVFALHYAHEYYDENPTAERGDARGLLFPGGETPDYWDFIHFSVVIGVAAQTADVAFTSKALRRIGTVHSVVAFAFNTVIVALTINLLAGLF